MIGALLTAVLLAATTHDIATTAANRYSPQGLRVAPGDTVRWQTSGFHPLAFDGEAGPPDTSGSYERVMTESVSFYCVNHGASGMTGVVTVGNANSAPSRATPSGSRCGSTGTWTATARSSTSERG